MGEGARIVTVRIAVLAGDGIGPEVTAAALATLPKRLEIVEIGACADRYLETGLLIDEDEIASIRHCDALLFGAIGDPRVEDGILERGVLLRLRKKLDLYVNLRPFPELGIVFVRENTEGLYAGLGEWDGDVAAEISFNSRHAIERCARFAFELAQTRSERLTLVHKANVLTYAGGLWREVTEGVAKNYPEVEMSYEHADAAAYHLVRDPHRFDVVLTDNLFGDLLSDVAAAVGAGLEHAASANLHPDAATRPGRCIGMFEPVHGSAPDIAGSGVADPSAAIGAARMMLDVLEKESAVL
jgi:3-isopropylmalate dehydrogenase